MVHDRLSICCIRANCANCSAAAPCYTTTKGWKWCPVAGQHSPVLSRGAPIDCCASVAGEHLAVLHAHATDAGQERRIEVGQIGRGDERLLIRPVDELEQMGAAHGVELRE